ncbi:putative disease resistance protein RGA3 [Solanum dulcamara]|uniref:putative disease resistance protein RGA3 n=1 Tax=Solanum dulcamara TaxID=45834 RepID=UPI0024852CED|nr:putative disease resistance protein RGA3 [Solanum dulcamara]
MDIEIIEYKLILKLNSVVDIAKVLNLHSLLPELEDLIKNIKYNGDYCQEVADILKVALCEAEHVVDKYEVYSLQSQLLSRSKTSKVINFFSGSNHFVLRIRMVFEIEKLVKKWRNEETLSVFPIVGVVGIGKTTLAKLVYNDPRIVSHFQLHLWVHVSRVFKVEKLLEQIVNSDPVKWDELKKSLIAGDCGSKILVTTRFDEVASMMGTVPAYCLKGLLSEDCLTLFLRKAFEQGQEVQHPNLVSIVSDIVQKCEGNPLLLMILGSSLHMETKEREWNDVNANYMWNTNQNDKILPALRVSYERLPFDLKVCLVFCSIFPKGYAIEIDKLIQVWVAEGLISKSNESEDLEHIAIQYFRELLLRSFFQDVEEYRSVYTSICTLHDLVYDLALSAAGVEFCTVNSHIQNVSDKVIHMAFSDYDLSGKELPTSLVSNRALRTISFSVDGVGPMSTMFVENCIARFMQLRVLDISVSCFNELPSSVGELKYLRYLDVSAKGNIKELPDSINNCNDLVSSSEGLQHLTSLRTLAIIGCPRLTFFPSTMKQLTALENLLIVDCEELTLLEWHDIEGLRMLRSLVIGGLPELESKDVQCLRNLQMLVLAGLPQLVTLTRWLEGASAALQYLRVERCLNFAALPQWLENLSALEKHEISKCRKTFSLPKGMSWLTNLKVFRIDN